MTHCVRATLSDKALLHDPCAHLPQDPEGVPYMATSTLDTPMPPGHVAVATPFSETTPEHAVVVVTVHSTCPAAIRLNVEGGKEGGREGGSLS